MSKIWEVALLIIPIVCSAVCTALTVHAENKVKKKGNTEKALMYLMKDQLRMQHERYMIAGKIGDDELGNFEEMYNVYHALGGNGTGTVWKNDLEKLERSIV